MMLVAFTFAIHGTIKERLAMSKSHLKGNDKTPSNYATSYDKNSNSKDKEQKENDDNE
jgi:uncharacterized membrane-anchored protein